MASISATYPEKNILPLRSVSESDRDALISKLCDSQTSTQVIETILTEAMKRHDVGLLQCAKKERGAIFNQMKGSMFFQAVGEKSIELAEFFLDAGVSVDRYNKHFETALHMAAWRSDSAMVDFLLKRGADPSLRDPEGRTALMIAAFRKAYRIVVELLNDHRCESAHEEVDGENRNALVFAVEGGSTPIVTRFLDHEGFASKRKTQYLLPIALKHHHVNLISPLEKGASEKEIHRVRGSTIEPQEAEVFESYLGRYGSPKTGRRKKGEAPDAEFNPKEEFERLMRLINNKKTEIVDKILEKHIEMATFVHKGTTLLHESARNNCAAITQLLLKLGAKPDAINSNGETPASIADKLNAKNAIRVFSAVQKRQESHPEVADEAAEAEEGSGALTKGTRAECVIA